MSEVLNEALALHHAGQWQRAAHLYESILAHTPDDPEALHWLGVLHGQQGQHARAAELIGRAVALRPESADFQSDLAVACRALGQHERAVGCCQAALDLQPNHPEALNNLGLALHALGRFEEALERFRAAVRVRPDSALFHYNLASTLRKLARCDEALVHCQRAVELAGGYALARALLGRLLMELGRPAEALPQLSEAVRLKPNAAELHHDLGNALRELKRPAEALAAYRQAVHLAPTFAPAHVGLGLLLKQEGDLGEAASWLQKAADLDQRNPHLWAALGEVYGQLGRAEAAISCWRRVLALDPGRADAHLGLGLALQQQSRVKEAGECYRTALGLKPDLTAAQLAIAGLHAEMGEPAEAEAAFRAALRMEATHPLPLAGLAKLLGAKLPEAEHAAMEKHLADPQLKPEDRAALMFAMVQILDERGDYSRAAEAARHANALTLECTRGRGRFDPAWHERCANDMVRLFDRDFVARVAGGGLPTRRPVFVFGLARSGTTLIEQVLASHPQVHGAGELYLARETFVNMPSLLGIPGAEVNCVPQLDATAVRRLAEHHLAQLRALDEGRAQRIVDKMPGNYMLLGFLAALFPQATFIHCRRDLRDVAVSCWLTAFTTLPWANHIAHLALVFRQYVRLMTHWKEVLPVQIHEVSYEETVRDLEGVARRLIAACGLDWHPACLEFHRTKRVIRTSSVLQVRQPIYTKSVERWKHYQGLLDDLFTALPLEEEIRPESRATESASA
jgi:tetratricopeptide (TPR) repeat protein